jgi:hypothetical protein
MVTLRIVSAAVLLAAVLGWPVGHTLAVAMGQRRTLWFTLSLLPWAIPPYVHVTVWASIVAFLPSELVAIWCLAIIAVPIFVWAWSSQPMSYLTLATAAIATGLLALTNFVVPDHLQLTLPSTAVYLHYSRTYEPFPALAMALPALASGLVLAASLGQLLPTTAQGSRPLQGIASKPLSVLAAFILVCVAGLPVAGLLAAGISALAASWRVGLTALMTTLMTSSVIAIATMVLAWIWHPWDRPRGVLTIGLLPAVLSGPAAATLILATALLWSSNNLGWFVLALFILAAPWGLTLSVLVGTHLGPLRSALCVGLATFILSNWEVGAALLLLPPGRTTFAVLFYDVLHYGSSRLAAGLALIWIALTGLPLAVAVWLWTTRSAVHVA